MTKHDSAGFSAPATLRVQTILFHNQVESLERTLESLANAAVAAGTEGVLNDLEVTYGDCSSSPLLSKGEIESWVARYRNILRIHYSFFDRNLGSARGHNLLAESARSQFLLFMNPDVLFAANTLIELFKPFQRGNVGMTEARQIPIEHPKEYNPITGETGWCTTACALVPRAIFESLNGFDAETFFLYCDDVDFSWRVRLSGYKTIYQPAATVFHDKRLSKAAGWIPSSAEQYYSAEAALFMAHKWSRPDLVESILNGFRSSGLEHCIRAAEKFETLRFKGQLPAPIDAKHEVGDFNNGNYTKHRFTL